MVGGAERGQAIGIELNGYVFYFLKLEVGFFGSGVVASQAVNVGLTVLPKVNRCLLVALLQDDFVLAVGEFTEFYRSRAWPRRRLRAWRGSCCCSDRQHGRS